MIGSLLSAIGFAAVKAEARRVRRRILVGAVTGALVVLAAGFALAAFAVWLAGELGTVQALALIAIGLLVIAGLVQAAVWIASSRRPVRLVAPSRVAEPQREGEPPAGSGLGAIGVVAVVGFLLARQLFRRR